MTDELLFHISRAVIHLYQLGTPHADALARDLFNSSKPLADAEAMQMELPAVPRVFLGIPTHDGRLHMRTAIAMRNAGIVCYPEITRGSLLPHIFNLLWHTAVSHGFDYFAMLHADVGADNQWLATMIHELQQRQALIVSAHCGMKDGSGCVSTAYDDSAGQVHKLTPDDIQALPQTFNHADLKAHQPAALNLLLNTGCMVADIRGDWARKVCFRFRTSCQYDANGPVIDVDSEDWELSRDMFAWGLGDRIYATSAVETHHAGEAIY